MDLHRHLARGCPTGTGRLAHPTTASPAGPGGPVPFVPVAARVRRSAGTPVCAISSRHRQRGLRQDHETPAEGSRSRRRSGARGFFARPGPWKAPGRAPRVTRASWCFLEPGKAWKCKTGSTAAPASFRLPAQSMSCRTRHPEIPRTRTARQAAPSEGSPVPVLVPAPRGTARASPANRCVGLCGPRQGDRSGDGANWTGHHRRPDHGKLNGGNS